VARPIWFVEEIAKSFDVLRASEAVFVELAAEQKSLRKLRAIHAVQEEKLI
jgi:hypothetical protein